MSLAALLACAAPPAPAASLDAGFWTHWGDGRAEIATYDLVQPRYGATHAGRAVLIFVTEDFSFSERVKADPGEHPDADLRKVIKLNHLRTFDTGIYTYDVMTSVFARLDAGDGMDLLDPLKLSFSAQEWCGMVYEELVPSATSVHVTGHTYFDSDTRPPFTLKVPADLLYGDAVPLWIRGLADTLAPGAARVVPWYPTLTEQRFRHVAPAVGRATLSRAVGTTEQVVPAGTFVVETWTVAVDGGTTTTWWVEAAAPHRIVGWETSEGERAALRGVDRLPYWQMNRPENVPDRAKVGL